MTIGWHFDNTYSKLSNIFKEDIKPVPVDAPELVILNDQLSKDLNLDFSKIDKKELSKIFSGNTLPEGSNAIAQAYAGHQFGHFTMLGDGRAVLLGEHITNENKRFDIQEEDIQTVEVEFITFSDLIKKYSINSIDKLQIDVEGAEYMIMNSINYQETKINKILFESKHFDGTFTEGNKLKEIKEKLISSGYNLEQVDKENILASK